MRQPLIHVMIPLMPQGVEHETTMYRLDVQDNGRWVTISVSRTTTRLQDLAATLPRRKVWRIVAALHTD